MQLVPSGIPLAFEVTYDAADLDVGLKVYDVSGVSPVLVDTSAMDHVDGGTYLGFFTPAANKTYLIRKSVYTDGSFATMDSDYSPGSETIVVYDESTTVNITPGDITAITAGIWNASTASYQVPGSFGQMINNLSNSSAPTTAFIGEIVGVVYEEVVTGVVT